MDDMPRLSSRLTVYYKRIFPAIWLGAVGGVGVFMSGVAFALGKQDAWIGVVGCLAMAVFGYVCMKAYLFGLVDGVWDGDDFLWVKNKGVEDRIEFSNICNVSHTFAMNPSIITLLLRTPSPIGVEIAFAERTRWFHLGRSRLARDLIERVEAAQPRAPEPT